MCIYIYVCISYQFLLLFDYELRKPFSRIFFSSISRISEIDPVHTKPESVTISELVVVH